MASLIELVQRQLGAEAIQDISRALGADLAPTRNAISAALPLLLGAMAEAASHPDQAKALAQAAGAHVSDAGSLTAVLGAAPLADGGGLVGRVLGRHRARVEEAVSRASGLDPQQAARLVLVLAPLVLGAIARTMQVEALPHDALADALREAQRDAQRRAPTRIGDLVERLMDQILRER
jgi:hypothetical protein